MSKSLRLSEKWFRRGLWLVAFAFASFLIGLGSKVVSNLNLVEEPLTLEQFIDARQLAAVQQAHDQSAAALKASSEALEQAQQRQKVAESNTATASATFNNWLATRHATARPDQDPELVARTRELDELKKAERAALAEVQGQEQKHLDADQAYSRAGEARARLNSEAQGAYEAALSKRELRVFGYRLALTLPPLALAAWLWMRFRKSSYWPFVWGFILFAGFTLFVELVPYLPSYGGYVRYIVGIVLTVVIGRQAIVGLQHYLERQQAAEAMPDTERREQLDYDMALQRVAKGVCPGCERPVALNDEKTDFCPHCGIGLYAKCGSCGTRKSTFNRFCFACGTQAADAPRL